MLKYLTLENQSVHNFSEPINISSNTIGDSLFDELIGTKAFQRLKSIRFLGGIDYLLVPSPNGSKNYKRYTRYQHSLGVARLAFLYSDAVGLTPKDRRLVYVAALLHDIGHAPLSHSLEPIFNEIFGINHHKATEDIITGRARLFGLEVSKILRCYNIDVECLISILDGNETGYHGLFSGPINFDTIEGILRARSYKNPNAGFLRPEAVIEAAYKRSSKEHLNVVDEFWSHKGYVYGQIINSKRGALVDYACQAYMRSNLKNITMDDYFVEETDIFRKLPGLRELLISPLFESRMRQIDQPVHYKVRQFFINPHADFFSRDDKGRYQQSKKECIISPDNSNTGESIKSERGLFDDFSDYSGETILGKKAIRA